MMYRRAIPDQENQMHPLPSWRIIEGDCRETLASLDAGSVHTCVTSPPYFGLRDYGHDGQIGLEPSPDEFVAALVGVFRGVRRVLRDDGTVWLNLGDTFCSTAPGTVNAPERIAGKGGRDGERGAARARARVDTPQGMKPKDLMGIPWSVAFALRADGWYLRSEIIWAKPNPMPESVTDRPTKAHEQVFLLSKSPRYFYDADAIQEEGASFGRQRSLRTDKVERAADGIDRKWHGPPEDRYDIPGRNKRSVWTVATQPYPGAHFATFPPKLIEPCILAGCPERACEECGAPWERVTDGATYYEGDDGQRTRKTNMVGNGHGGGGRGPKDNLGASIARTLGFAPLCSHDAPAVPGTVLDPFAGAGTTGVVCGWHGREFIGCELNPEYAALARDRITAEGKPWRPKSQPPRVSEEQMDLLA